MTNEEKQKARMKRNSERIRLNQKHLETLEAKAREDSTRKKLFRWSGLGSKPGTHSSWRGSNR